MMLLAVMDPVGSRLMTDKENLREQGSDLLASHSYFKLCVGVQTGIRTLMGS